MSKKRKVTNTGAEDKNQGRPALLSAASRSSILQYVFKNILSILAFLVSVGALYMSYLAIKESREAVSNYRLVEKLGIDPVLRLYSDFCMTSDCVPKLKIRNDGKVDAIQSRLVFSGYISAPESHDMFMRFNFSDWDYSIPAIEPGRVAEVSLPKGFLSNAIAAAKKFKVNFSDGKTMDTATLQENRIILEVLVTFVRKADLKEYRNRALYFLNPEGRLVSDQDSTVQGKIYQELRQAAIKHFNMLPDPDRLLTEVGADRTYPTIK